MQGRNFRQAVIRLGTHGEDYGNWMPVSMLWLVGGLAALAAVISLLSFAVFHITALGVVLRGRRHDGAGPPGRPLPSGF